MNFFQHQDQAKKYTRHLLLLFTLAVVCLIVITTLFVAMVLFMSDTHSGYASSQMGTNSPSFWHIINTKLILTVAAVVLTVVVMGSLYKWLQLSDGGERVAASLGGQRLMPNTNDPAERQLLNVVEEMAIASGTPVPPVFLMEEAGINAFAAGETPKDAVIGVTRGCMQLLSRDELQGVIAHEFSHILHGDMRINMRLIGVLHGILVIGLIGSVLMRSGFYSGMYSGAYRSRSNDRNNSGGIVILGLGLVVIGYCGTFFGKLIKSAVSRQREFLADASAVQFTRNPDGIGGALKKIGGYSEGSRLHHPNAEEFSHMYFGEGLSSAFGSMLATHPPLEERIRRISPAWDGHYVHMQPSQASRPVPSMQDARGSRVQTAADVSAVVSAAALAAANARGENTDKSAFELEEKSLPPEFGSRTADHPLQHIGQPTPAHVATASALIGTLPSALQDAAHDPFAARALVYNLLLDNSDTIQSAQWQQLQQRAHPAVFKLSQQLQAEVRQLAHKQRLPLLGLAIPALKQLSSAQYSVFKENVVALIKADQQVDVFEWSLYRILMNALEPKPAPAANTHLRQLAVPCQQLISTLATAGHDNPEQGEAAYRITMQQLGFANLPLLGGGQISLPMLDAALQQLQQLKPLQKPALLKAMLLCIEHDGRINSEEYELFRAIADCLDCPIPPQLED